MATPLAAGALARGLSAGMSRDQAIQGLFQTAMMTEIWKSKIRWGLIDLLAYLTQ